MLSTRTARLTAALAGGLALVVVVVALVLVGSDDDARSQGPLSSDVDESLAFTVNAGRPFTFGRPVAYNTGDEPAVLERIGLVSPSPGLRVIATRAAGEGRRILYLASDFRWPSPEITAQEPVAGFEVAPESDPAGNRGVELVFGLRVSEPGRYEARGVTVDYRVGDTEHRAALNFPFRVCARPGGRPIATPPRCPIPRLDAEEG